MNFSHLDTTSFCPTGATKRVAEKIDGQDCGNFPSNLSDNGVTKLVLYSVTAPYVFVAYFYCHLS